MVYFVCKVPAPSHGISLAGTYLAKAFCCFRSYLTWGLAVMYTEGEPQTWLFTLGPSSNTFQQHVMFLWLLVVWSVNRIIG